MEIEVTKPYNRFRQCEDDNMRVISVWCNGYNFDILLGLTYRQPSGGGTTTEVMYGGNHPLHKASIAVGVNYLGEMVLFKNRYGPNGSNDEHTVRQTIIDSLWGIGFTHLESLRVMLEFNSCITEITGEPILHTNTNYPYGISRRRYMTDEYKKTMVKRYGIKRHSLV